MAILPPILVLSAHERVFFLPYTPPHREMEVRLEWKEVEASLWGCGKAKPLYSIPLGTSQGMSPGCP